MALKGNDLIIKLNGTALAACKSCDITHSCDTVNIAATEYGEYENAKPTRQSWKVSASVLVADITNLNDMVGQTYTLAFTYRKNGVKVSGGAICTQCKVTATRGNMCQGAFEFQGTGPLT